MGALMKFVILFERCFTLRDDVEINSIVALIKR